MVRRYRQRDPASASSLCPRECACPPRAILRSAANAPDAALEFPSLASQRPPTFESTSRRLGLDAQLSRRLERKECSDPSIRFAFLLLDAASAFSYQRTI